MGAAEILRMPREQYDLIKRDNWSKLKLIGRSPAHYLHNALKGHADSGGFKFGRATHLATLEPELFLSEVAVWEEGRRYGKKWDAFQERHSGQDIIAKDENDECLSIASVVRAHPAARKYLSGGRAEQTVLWTHVEPALAGLPGFEMECKARLDFIANCGAIVDLKTTTDASPDGFGSQVWRYQYHVQAAFYCDGVRAVTGKTYPYVLVAVEKTPPYVTQVYRVPEIILDLGRDEYRRLLSLLKCCRDENKWDGYSDGELELTLPKWAVDFGDDDDVSGLDLVFGEAQTG